ncbi:MAG: glycosyltransferase [Lentisphaerota bacterium]
MNIFELLDYLLLISYIVPSLLLMFFGLNLYFSLGLCLRRLGKARKEVTCVADDFQLQHTETDLPHVVTQLPVYNEINVVERAMRAAAAMSYPKGRHTIQVLDDSTDDTRDLVDRIANELNAAGHDFQVVRRTHREGFKAGALSYGMEVTDAQFFAIFDADFVPPVDFLMRTVPVLVMKKEIGLVQARWGHLNEKSSFLTIAQGLGIDAHFAVEQPARAWNNLFMTFNGTAGLWRKQAIIDAGGWQNDTLTEDMDLSYRSQLAGWKPFFISDLVVEGEIPDNINAFKIQQFRWAKGSIQTAIKLLPRVFRSDFSWLAKMEAFFHMTYYGIFPLMVWVALLTLPIYRLIHLSLSSLAFTLLSVLLAGSAMAPPVLCVAAQLILKKEGWKKLIYFPALLALGIGIAISNSRAVIEAVLGIKSAFIRTPKKGQNAFRLYNLRFSYGVILELLVGLYCFGAFAYFLHIHNYMAIPYLLINGLGFTIVGLLSIWHFVNQNMEIKQEELPEPVS